MSIYFVDITNVLIYLYNQNFNLIFNDDISQQ